MPVARDTNEQTTITSSTPTHAWYKIINNDKKDNIYSQVPAIGTGGWWRVIAWPYVAPH
jgi:nitrate reductase alpha subunit